MKLARILFTAIAGVSFVTASVSVPQPSSDEFEVSDEYPTEWVHLQQLAHEYHLQKDRGFAKRDNVATLEGIIVGLVNSNVIDSTLQSVAASNSTMQSIAQYTIGLINSTLHSNGSSLSSLSINLTQILGSLESSGLLTTTLDGILRNTTNRNMLGGIAGQWLCQAPWIAQLLVDLGNGQALTWEYLYDDITKTKAKATDNTSQNLTQFIVPRQQLFSGLSKRDTSSNNYTGSASALLGNILGQVLKSGTLSSTLNDLFVALNQTNVLVPLTFDLMQSKDLYTILANVLPPIYQSGVLNPIDLNKYYVKYKKNGLLSDGLQAVLTNQKYSPPLAQFFQIMEYSGVYDQVQANIFGRKEKKN